MDGLTGEGLIHAEPGWQRPAHSHFYNLQPVDLKETVADFIPTQWKLLEFHLWGSREVKILEVTKNEGSTR